jgi:hypothetical protein
MSKSESTAIKWLKTVEEQDYPAAESYLLLLYDGKRVAKILKQLRKAPISKFRAKDLFRASQLSVLGVSNSHIEKDRKKIRNGHALSPLLLVRDSTHSKLIIADGYHRMCAVYGFDEDAWIHCKIV